MADADITVDEVRDQQQFPAVGAYNGNGRASRKRQNSITESAPSAAESKSSTVCSLQYDRCESLDPITEINDWFHYEDCELLKEIRHEFEARFGSIAWTNKATADKRKVVDSLFLGIADGSEYSSLLCLCYLACGSFVEARTSAHHLEMIHSNTELLFKSKHFPLLYSRLQLFMDTVLIPEELIGIKESRPPTPKLHLLMTIFYLCIESHRSDPEFVSFLDSLTPNWLEYLNTLIDRLRWNSPPQNPSASDSWNQAEGVTWEFVLEVFNLFSKSLLALFGSYEDLELADQFMHERYKLPYTRPTKTNNTLCNSSSNFETSAGKSNDLYSTPNKHSNGAASKSDREPSREASLVTASPVDYHAFRSDVMSRFPLYSPPPSFLPDKYENDSASITNFIQVVRPTHEQQGNVSLPPPTAHIATPAPSPPSSPAVAAGQKVRKSMFLTNPSFPFLFPSDGGEVPKSIQEAGELFASRVVVTPSDRQLWEEQDRFMKSERGWVTDQSNSTDSAVANDNIALEIEKFIDTDHSSHTASISAKLRRVDKFYKNTIPSISSTIYVLLREMLACSSSFELDAAASTQRRNEITAKAISSILDTLGRWYRVSHIMKFEFFCSILFDDRFYLLVFRYLYSHDIFLKTLITTDDSSLLFFEQCRRLSEYSDEFYGVTAAPECNELPEFGDGTIIEQYNKRFLFTTINYLQTLRWIITGKTKRVVIVADLPAVTLKKVFSVYQPDLWELALSIFKDQVQYNGKKWKYGNMDVISAIYLHCNGRLRDDWLLGNDVTAEVQDACAQEVALRALVQFYHERRYKDMLRECGHVDKRIEFFIQELDSLTVYDDTAWDVNGN